MKSFGINLIPFVAGAALFWLLGWYQANFHAQEGDLVRTGFLITKRHYDTTDPIPTARDTTIHDILLIGDSHLDQSPVNRRFQHHLNSSVSAHSRFSYEGVPNPFMLGVALAREQRPKIVVFEMVERNLVGFAQQYLNQDSIRAQLILAPKQNTPVFEFSHLGNGVRTAAGLLNFRHKWLKNDQCEVLSSRGEPPLHNHDQLLFLNKIWELRKPPNEVTSIVDSLQQVLTQQLDAIDSDFIIYVIPDKATVYSDFFESSNLHPSFLLNDTLPSKVHSPIHSMRKAVNDGVMEVYKYSDTHLGLAGAQIVGNHLQSLLDEHNDLAPNALQ